MKNWFLSLDFEVFKVSLFGGTLALILMISCPVGPLEVLERWIQPPLSLVGLDVSNTPLTADMMLMQDRLYQESLYKSEISLNLRGAEGQKKWSFDRLPFYRWNIPFILMVEKVYWQLDFSGELYALCHYLQSVDPTVSEFSVNINKENRIAQPAGLNRIYQCPNTRS